MDLNQKRESCRCSLPASISTHLPSSISSHQWRSESTKPSGSFQSHGADPQVRQGVGLPQPLQSLPQVSQVSGPSPSRPNLTSPTSSLSTASSFRFHRYHIPSIRTDRLHLSCPPMPPSYLLCFWSSRFWRAGGSRADITFRPSSCVRISNQISALCICCCWPLFSLTQL